MPFIAKILRTHGARWHNRVFKITISKQEFEKVILMTKFNTQLEYKDLNEKLSLIFILCSTAVPYINPVNRLKINKKNQNTVGRAKFFLK